MNLLSSTVMLLTADGVTPSTDLFSSDWTVGNLYEVQGLVNVLGHLAVVVISAVGFGIVIFSIIKNAMSGLYVVNPPFWDKVDQLKKELVGDGNGGGNAGMLGQSINGLTGAIDGKTNNKVAGTLGGFLTLVLSYIPNIKALTDFEGDANPDKKQYFAKAIPLLIAQIFIGTLIFMGYPTKIASWIGNGGTYIIDSVINNVDPVETVKKISDGIFVYSLASDGAQDPYEQNINQFTRELVRVVTTKYTDMKKDSVQNTALAIEQDLDAQFDNDAIRNVLGVAEGYNVTCSAITQTTVPTVTSSFSQLNDHLYASQASNGTTTYRYFLNAANLDTGSTMSDTNDWFVLSVVGTPEAVSNASSAGLIVFGGYLDNGFTVDSKSNAIKLTVQGIHFGNGANDIKGSLGKTITVNIVNSEGLVEKSFQANIQSSAVTNTSNATAVLYFTASDKEALGEAVKNTAYLSFSAPSDWTYDVKNGNSSSTTLRVSEIRLTPGTTTMTGALATWTDVDATTAAGEDLSSWTPATLAKTSMAGN